MKKDIADKWVKALRSARYTQGVGALRPPLNTFCCLGVLCDLAPSTTGEWSGDGYVFEGPNGPAVEKEVLPTPVLDWAGLKSHTGQLPASSALSTLNDTGKSFDDIADIIEKNWEEL